MKLLVTAVFTRVIDLGEVKDSLKARIDAVEKVLVEPVAFVEDEDTTIRVEVEEIK